MKLIQEGIDFDGWYVGAPGVCATCAAVVEFDDRDGDKVRRETSYQREGDLSIVWSGAGGAGGCSTASYQREGDLSIVWECPMCGKSNSRSGPTAEQQGKVIHERRAAVQADWLKRRGY